MSETKNLRAEASVAGGLGGTGLVGIANLLPAHLAWLKAILIYVAPAASVGLALVWALVSTNLRSWYNKRNLDIAIKEARAARDRIIGDPMASPAHKDNAQLNVERLEQLKFVMLQEQVSAVRATLTDDED